MATPRHPGDLDAVDYFRELCEPHTHAERYSIRRRGQLTRHTHRTTVPALVAQLWANDIPSATSEGGTGLARASYGSKPAAKLDALDAASRIHHAAAEWLRELGVEPAHHATIKVLRQLHGMLPGITDRKVLRRLERDVRSWWAQARVVTGWDTPAWQPDATCPNCGARGSLKVRLADRLAMCTAAADDVPCGAVWDELTIAFLADHIRGEAERRRAADSPRLCMCPLPRPEHDDVGPLCPRCGSSRCANALLARLRAQLTG